MIDKLRIKDIIASRDTWYLKKFENELYIKDLKREFAYYYYSKYSQKPISFLLENGKVLDLRSRVIDEYGRLISNIVIKRHSGRSIYTINEYDKNMISNIIYTKFKTKWDKLFYTLIVDYDPLKPFLMDVSEKTINNLFSKENRTNNTQNENISNDKTLQNETNTENNIYGFNSVNAVPSDKSKETFSDENESKSVDKNMFKGDTTYERSNPTERTTIRKGNIGNITIQELLEKERNVWQYQLWDTMCEDINSLFTRSIY